jgi:esterase
MQLFYKKFGEGEPLIILHGLMGMLDNWQGPAKYYAAHFETYIVDLRNHGHSPHSNDFNYELMMNDLLEFVEEHQLHRVHLMGHSMGGKVVMKFAQNYPDYVNKLIVSDIAPRSYEIHHRHILDGLLAVPLNDINSRGEAEKIMAEYIPELGVRQFLLKNLYWKEKNKLAWRFNLQSINQHIEKIGEEINDRWYDGETLFVRGEHSHYISDSDEEMIKLYFPQSTIITIPQSGHWIHAEQPEKYIQETLLFLEN